MEQITTTASHDSTAMSSVQDPLDGSQLQIIRVLRYASAQHGALLNAKIIGKS